MSTLPTFDSRQVFSLRLLHARIAETKKEEEKRKRTERIFGPGGEIPSFARHPKKKDSAAQLYEIKSVERSSPVEESSLGWRSGISLGQMGKLRFEEILNYSQQRFETVHPCFAIVKREFSSSWGGGGGRLVKTSNLSIRSLERDDRGPRC